VSPVAALLVDADSRVSPGVERLINLNELGSQFKYLYGAISEGNGQVDFVEQDFMSSSLDRLVADNAGSAIKEVPIIDQNVILSTLPPPYDLIKIDIEGGEYDFLLGYEQVLKNANILLVEWHSWHRGGGSGKQIQHIAESYGFYLKKIVQDPKSCGEPGSNREVGVFLFSKD
jgi:FkbM family methyltransferase